MFDGAHPNELVETAPPRVTLRNAFAHPFDSAIAAARTCYAPRLIGPEEITDKQRVNIERIQLVQQTIISGKVILTTLALS